MFSVAEHWNPNQALLKQTLTKGKIDEAKELFYDLHSKVHSSNVYEKQEQSYLDEIYDNLCEKTFRSKLSEKDDSIVWNIWHITRIEDITSNIVIANSNQVLNEDWLKRLNIAVKDTGNSMSHDEIVCFSNEINLEELKNYRDSVGLRTKKIIEELKGEDLKRKVTQVQLKTILEEEGVLTHPDSIWLLEFWGRKNVSGILLMPITRHQIVHLNDCKRIKQKCFKHSL